MVPLGVDGSPHTTTIFPLLSRNRFARAVTFAAENISAVVESFLTLYGYTPHRSVRRFITGMLWVSAIIGTEDRNLETL